MFNELVQIIQARTSHTDEIIRRLRKQIST